MLEAFGQPVRIERAEYDDAGEAQYVGVDLYAKQDRIAASEIIGDVTERSIKLIISPTPLIAKGWPFDRTGAAVHDVIVPRKERGDYFLIDGRRADVQSAIGRRIGRELVRIEVYVAGE